MSLSKESLRALVAAILAVNSYPIWRVQELLPSLEKAGLLDPEHVAMLDMGTLTVKLAEAGYDRGMLTCRLAERLADLMRTVERGQLDELERLLTTGDKKKATELLLKVRGIGPTVARSVWALLETI